jgi:MFS family permease
VKPAAPYGTDPSGYPLDRFGLSRPVWLLGWVSFFTDTASEMVYPLLPLFLTQVLGAGAMSLGVIEGVAEAANSVLKVVSGWLADRWDTPKRLVLGGYGLSSLVRPLIALVTAWPQVLLLRFTDRLGKGIRTSPRDAMLARFAPGEHRGRVYGFHRAMDHAGAVMGPLAASAYLYFNPEAYRSLFAWTLVPGIIVVLILLRVPESRARDVRKDDGSVRPERDTRSVRLQPDQHPAAPLSTPPHPSAPLSTPQHPSAPLSTPQHPSAPLSTPQHPSAPIPRRFYLAVTVILLFSLGNASDAFLLLRLSNLGVAAVWIPLLWSALHVVKVMSSIAGGAMSDRFGRRTMIGLGWLVYAAIYLAFGYVDHRGTVIAVFLAYGLYFGLTEGVEKAWVADMAPADRHGTAFGIYNAALGIGTLLASLLFGLLWTRVSPASAFFTGGGLALAATVLLYLLFPRNSANPTKS